MDWETVGFDGYRFGGRHGGGQLDRALVGRSTCRLIDAFHCGDKTVAFAVHCFDQFTPPVMADDLTQPADGRGSRSRR